MEATETFRKSFGRRLAAQRERAGLTAKELSKILSVHINTIYQLEHGDQWISSELLDSISKTFGVSPAVFFTDEVVKIEPTPQEALEIVENALQKRQKLRPDMVEKLATLNENQIGFVMSVLEGFNQGPAVKGDLLKKIKKTS